MAAKRVFRTRAEGDTASGRLARRQAIRLAVLVALGCGEARTPPSSSEARTLERTAEILRGPAALVMPHKVHVVDVGTGLASVVTGADFTLIYDGGSNDDLPSGKSNRFVDYLRAIGQGPRINHVVVSHAHRDHVELLPDVFAEYDVKEVWEPGVFYKPCAYLRLLQAVASEQGVLYHSAAHEAGTRRVPLPKSTCKIQGQLDIPFGARIRHRQKVILGAFATLTFLHVDGEAHHDINENSLVVRLDLAGSSVLFTGDAGGGERTAPEVAPKARSVEAELLDCCKREIDVDVLIVGHHGSKTSSRRAFLDAVSPKLSVISSGPKEYDRVRLPDPEVVRELKNHGPVFRTDLNDATCRINPQKIGRDEDGKPGGCDNVQIEIGTNGALNAEYYRGYD